MFVDQLAALSDAGVSIWLDDLSRQRLASGSLDRLVRDDHVVGVTTNPTIFASGISRGDAYDAQIAELALRGVEVSEALRTLTTFDVRWACDVLRPVYDGTDGVDGRVSIEVDPRLAHDTAATIAEARALWWLVDRPNLFIKIPAVRQGVPAIAACLAEGISINVTLIFSLARYHEVTEAFLNGLERAVAAGRDPARIHSVASLFVSRVDREVDARLDAIGTSGAAALRGRAAIANARLAYADYERVFSSPRWAPLHAAGARLQRPLWASTGVTDPAYRDTHYVVDLIAPGVVNTMPEDTLRAVADHADVPGHDTIRGHYHDAHQVLDGLHRVGVDYDDVVATLEEQGVPPWPPASPPASAPRPRPASNGEHHDRRHEHEHARHRRGRPGRGRGRDDVARGGLRRGIVLIGAEDDAPYNRPPLSKEYLQGTAARDTIDVHPHQWYVDNHVDLRLGVTVTGIDPAAHEVSSDDGARIRYAELLLATGSSPRRLPVPGADLDGVEYLRTVGDSDRIKTLLGSAQRVAVIGAGWIGLEVAAAARLAGVAVTVLDTEPLPLLRVLGPEVAQVFADLHRAHGVDLRLGVQVAEIVPDGDGRARGVRLGDGALVAADAVIIGIGVAPNTALAQAAGLERHGGV